MRTGLRRPARCKERGVRGGEGCFAFVRGTRSRRDIRIGARRNPFSARRVRSAFLAAPHHLEPSVVSEPATRRAKKASQRHEPIIERSVMRKTGRKPLPGGLSRYGVAFDLSSNAVRPRMGRQAHHRCASRGVHSDHRRDRDHDHGAGGVDVRFGRRITTETPLGGGVGLRKNRSVLRPMRRMCVRERCPIAFSQ